MRKFQSLWAGILVPTRGKEESQRSKWIFHFRIQLETDSSPILYTLLEIHNDKTKWQALLNISCAQLWIPVGHQKQLVKFARVISNSFDCYQTWHNFDCYQPWSNLHFYETWSKFDCYQTWQNFDCYQIWSTFDCYQTWQIFDCYQTWSTFDCYRTWQNFDCYQTWSKAGKRPLLLEDEREVNAKERRSVANEEILDF